jgi:opacity protein-like surface antigen
MRRIAWLALGILSFVVPAASAQQAPRADVSFGYSYLREGFSGGSNAQGGNISGAGYFNDWFGIAGDFGGYHVSEFGVSANTYTYLVGPRFSANRKGRTSVFVQALVGGDRLTAGGGSSNGFSWSTGGGVEFALSHHIALRPEFDYIGLRFQNNTTHSARASVNIVFRFGGK